MRLEEKNFYYHNIITIWEGFCRLHKELFDLTCEEYLTLLESDMDKLEQMIPLKEEIIAKIAELERERAGLIEKLNDSGLVATQVKKAGDLLVAFADIDKATGIPALQNLNSLLIDIVTRIQEQNRKNQMFLNKAMISIREIKQGFSGKKTYSTYGADGMTRQLAK